MITRNQTVKKYIVTEGVLSYSIPFPIYEFGDVLVVWSDDEYGVDEHKLVLGSDYSVTMNSAGDGGTVTLKSGIVPIDAILAVISNIPETQELDLSHTSEVDTKSTEKELDRQVQMIQQISDKLGRCIKVGVTSKLTPDELLKTIFKAYHDIIDSLSEAGSVTGATPVVATGTSEPRALKDRFADIINVKDFGAKGDGVTDDTEAFKAAAAKGRNVFVPAGTYKVTGQQDGIFFSTDNPVFTDTILPVSTLVGLREQVEAASGGRRTVRFNKDGVPSIFYRLPMFYLDDIISTWPHKPHPAFILNDGPNGSERVLREILIGCYEASLYDDKYAVSLPGMLPHTYQPFDIALAYCRANNVQGGISVEYSRNNSNNYTVTPNGHLDTRSHFHMMTNAEYAAIALWCWKMGYEPRGNSWYGQNTFHTEEKGKYPTHRHNYDQDTDDDPYLGEPGNTQKYVIDGDPSSGINPKWGNCPCVTGSSPATWTHDGTPEGIENIVGNTSCMCTGVRVYNGQLQSFVNNNAALPEADFCGRVPLSPQGYDNNEVNEQRYYEESWKGYKAFDTSGNFISPTTTSDTLKIDGSYMSDGRKTPVYDGDTLVRTYGCGMMTFATKIDVPDSGGTDQTKFSYDESTGKFYLDPENGTPNGSAANDFWKLDIAPDSPDSDPKDYSRSVAVQPSETLRALGLYPICSHSDLYPDITTAQAANRNETVPETGLMTEITHNGYYYDNGYVYKDSARREEIVSAYKTQKGRVWSRVPGDRPVQRGGTYYYDNPKASYSDPENPNCALWTTTYANRRYASDSTNVPGSINPTDLGVGWMNGYRVCFYDE